MSTTSALTSLNSLLPRSSVRGGRTSPGARLARSRQLSEKHHDAHSVQPVRDGSQSDPRIRLRQAAALVPLWLLIVAQLPPHEFEYSTNAISPLLGITHDALRVHCRDLWPDWDEGRWRIDFNEAAVLIYHVSSRGRKLPDKEKLYFDLLDRGIIQSDFPINCPVMQRAESAIRADRERRVAARRARNTSP
jgi:hypothetical protein